MELSIKNLTMSMVPALIAIFRENAINRSASYFAQCCGEQTIGLRDSLVAFIGTKPVGLVHLIKNSHYPEFRKQNIPEIIDLVVVEDFRRRGIGERLIKASEALAIKQGYTKIGLGVGLYKDYGSAQRLYHRLGYRPDGNGIMYQDKPVFPGTTVPVDDDLALYLIKDLEN